MNGTGHGPTVSKVPSSVDESIAAYYERAAEETRLEQIPFRLEEIRTRELIQRHAPAAPATVVDVGGAAGAYAIWLAGAGYTVHLLDAAPRLVAEARRRAVALSHPLASCQVGDARALEFTDGCADIVLLLGPLYHLIDAGDRARALYEVARVLKPEGLVFAAAISRYASALDGVGRDLFQDPRFGAIVEQDLREGQHRNPTDRLDYFTTAYFHRPDDLRAEVQSAGLELEGLYGLEGPGMVSPGSRRPVGRPPPPRRSTAARSTVRGRAGRARGQRPSPGGGEEAKDLEPASRGPQLTPGPGIRRGHSPWKKTLRARSSMQPCRSTAGSHTRRWQNSWARWTPARCAHRTAPPTSSKCRCFGIARWRGAKQVLGAIDDGRLRAFRPFTLDFIRNPDGSVAGE